MSNTLLNKNVGFQEDKGLQLIKSFLSDYLTLTGLYCFGIHNQNNLFCNALNGEIKSDQQTHYYLLVFCLDSKENAVADLSDLIKKRSKGQYVVTLLIHKHRTVKHLSNDKCYFFYHAINNGLNLLDANEVRAKLEFPEEPVRAISKIKAYWSNRSRVSEVFLESQKMVDGSATEPIQEAMLQIAMENISLALIDTFLGYRPIHFHLGYLFEIIDLFCPFSREIFPRNTEQETKLFELLSKNIRKLRSANLIGVDYLSTALLQRRCQLFHEKAVLAIETEIKRLDQHKKEMTPTEAI